MGPFQNEALRRERGEKVRQEEQREGLLVRKVD